MKKLSGADYITLINYLEEESKRADERAEKRFLNIQQALDRNMTAAFILNTDLELKEINNSFEESFELIKEDNQKVKKMNDEGEGNWMKVAEKLALEVAKVSEDLYRKGIGKKESIEILMAEYPQLSKSMITNAWKKTVDLIKEGDKLLKKSKEEEIEEDPDVVYAYNEIFGEEEKENKEEKRESEVKTGLKILKKQVVMDIQGEFGIYKVENNKVEIDGAVYNSKEDIEAEYKNRIEHLEKSRNEAIEIYNIIEKELI